MRTSVAVAALLAAAGSANADIVDLMVFEIIATNLDTGATATQGFSIEPGTADDNGSVFWQLDGPLSFDGIGRLDEASIHVSGGRSSRGFGGQSVVADFSVFSSAQNSSFQINSAVVSFSTINAVNAQAIASAAVTLIDGTGDGAVLTPGASGGYNAFFNNGATLFTDLFPAGTPLTVSSSAGIGSFGDDTGGFLPAGTDVDSISASWDFALSGFDSATGTSTFTIIPAPASATLLGLGGIAAIRRRR